MEVGEKNIFIKYKTRLEKNLLSSVSLLLLICQIFCAAPVNIDFYTKRVAQVKSFAQFGGFYGFLKFFIHSIWSFTVLGCIITSTYYQNMEFDHDMEVIQKALYMGEYVFGTINVIIIILGCQWQRSQYGYHLKCIVDLTMRLQRFGFTPRFEETKIFFRRWLLIFGVFFLIVGFIDLLYNQLVAKSFFRSSTVYTIPNVISCMAILQLVGILFIHRSMLRHINDHLMDLDGISPVTPSSVIFVQEAIETIESLRKVHRDLARTAEMAIRNFSILILTTLTACFLILSIQLFALYQMFENYARTNFFLLTYTVLWIFLHGGKIVMIVYFSCSFTREKHRTGQVLYHMEIRRQFQSDSLQNTVSKFSMQIIHEPKNLSACGIIDLDLSLLNTIVGSLTTYLVILIQFDVSARQMKNCNVAEKNEKVSS
ncbi:putative gustatory receptor 59f [Phlebotomus argentipes]|uniref:putative gustatory receptor 59f n=1 Tax=Phlebotomus argentipes TaxID=94469 RepID=UPI002893499D|nr:putative gustatory receptor 59f [Phlebotomus argentipes]